MLNQKNNTEEKTKILRVIQELKRVRNVEVSLRFVVLIIVFFVGSLSALTLATYKGWLVFIFGEAEKISNTASVSYEDSSGNSYGPSPSNTVEVTKTADNPPSTITNLAISGTTINSITLSWTAPSDDGSKGQAESYDLRYSTGQIDDKNWADANKASNLPTPSSAGTSESLTIDKLTEDTAYFFAIKSTDDKGNISTLSNVVQSKTNRPIEPSDQKISKITITLPQISAQEQIKIQILSSTTDEVLLENKWQADANKTIEIQPTDLNQGTYNILIIAPYCLAKKIEKTDLVDNFTISTNLIQGNLQDSDDLINSLDWAIMRSNWGTQNTQPAADINGDGIVNVLDWSLMNKNWGVRGNCLEANEADCRRIN